MINLKMEKKMKIFTLLILALFTCVSFAEIGPVGRSVSLDATGAVQEGSLDKYFVSVKNVSGGALNDGDLVILDLSADDGYSVTTSTTAGQIPHCILDEACADDAMCRCQTYGYKSNVNFDVTSASAVAGTFAFLGENSAGTVQADGTPAFSDRPVGVFYDAAAASGDVELFIKLR